MSGFIILNCLKRKPITIGFATAISNVGYPFTNTIGNNTPGNFKTALQLIKEKLLSDPNGPRILNINCWSEWTEGSYLEPDTIHGMKYLEAVKEIFGNK